MPLHRPAYQPLNRIVQVLFSPYRPERPRGASRSVLGLVTRQGHEHLAVKKELGDTLLFLIVGQLINGQINGLFLGLSIGGALALHDNQRDAVDEQDDIGDIMFLIADPLHLKFRCAVKGIFLRVFPIDIVDGKAFGVSFNRLRYARSET